MHGFGTTVVVFWKLSNLLKTYRSAWVELSIINRLSGHELCVWEVEILNSLAKRKAMS